MGMGDKVYEDNPSSIRPWNKVPFDFPFRLEWLNGHFLALINGECLEAELIEKWVFCSWLPQIGIIP